MSHLLCQYEWHWHSSPFKVSDQEYRRKTGSPELPLDQNLNMFSLYGQPLHFEGIGHSMFTYLIIEN